MIVAPDPAPGFPAPGPLASCGGAYIVVQPSPRFALFVQSMSSAHSRRDPLDSARQVLSWRCSRSSTPEAPPVRPPGSHDDMSSVAHDPLRYADGQCCRYTRRRPYSAQEHHIDVLGGRPGGRNSDADGGAAWTTRSWPDPLRAAHPLVGYGIRPGSRRGCRGCSRSSSGRRRRRCCSGQRRDRRRYAPLRRPGNSTVQGPRSKRSALWKLRS